MKQSTKLRILYGGVFILLVMIEVLIALFVHDNFVRPYLGDVIVIVVLYFFVKFFFVNATRLLPLYLFIFATFVEIGQYLHFVSLIGLDNIEFFRVLMGTSFSWYDIICYAAGSLICYILYILENCNTKRRNQNECKK